MSRDAMFVGREVSCRSFATFTDAARREKIPLDRFLEGTGVSEEHVLNKRERVSWAVFCRFLTNAGLVWSRDRIEEIASQFPLHPAARPFTLPARLFIGPGDLYRWTADPKRGPMKHLASCMRYDLHELSEYRHECLVTLAAGYEWVPELRHMCLGGMRGTPRLLGLGDAEVEMERVPEGVLYRIHTPTGGRILSRFRRSVLSTLTARSAATELREAYETLHDSNQKLQTQTVQRRRTENALRASEEALRSVVSHTPVVLFAIDADGIILMSEGKGLEPLGALPGEAVGKSAFELYANHPPVLDACRRVLRGESLHVTLKLRDSYFETHFTPRRDEAGNLNGALGVATDVSDRIRAEHARKESERRFRTIFEQVNTGIVVADPDGLIIHANPYFMNLVGYSLSELQTMRIPDITHPDDRGRTAEAMRATQSEKFVDLRKRYRHKDGHTVWAEVATGWSRDSDGRRTYRIGVINDITKTVRAEAEKAELESQLRQQSKMQALGTLAGGVAHDFNNILTSILGNTELAMAEIPAHHPAREDLDGVLSAAVRARDLVDQILTFSRKGSVPRAPIDVQPTIQQAVDLLQSSMPKSIGFRTYLGAPSARVMGNASQIHQIVVNLATNAQHAMPQGGTLEVRLEASGRTVDLTVADSGCGIDPEDLDRIFDPFFTTRAEGTGMGLSVVHGIVRAHEGVIHVNSKPDVGTRVRIRLPRLLQEASVDGDAEVSPECPRAMFVDDDETVVRVGESLLTAAGFRVSSFTSSREALAAFAAAPMAYDLVVTDRNMPEMSGEALLRELLRVRPEMPVILCTGCVDGLTPDLVRSMGFYDYLAKPLAHGDLVRSARRALRSQAAGPRTRA